MAIGRDGSRASQLRVCLDAAAEYQLTTSQATSIVEGVVAIIREQWQDAADAVRLTEIERGQLWERQILNPFIFYNWPESTPRGV